ncbi:MAG: acyltransferase [Clostridia bacterium]|nr:acyltransferase [Clostridia bacterium]
MRIQATAKTLISRSATSVLKIFFETLVLFHHMYSPKTELGNFINGVIGPMGVAGFMLLSGFGVGVSFLKKGDGYLKSLTGKRIPRMYLTVVIADLFFLIQFYLMGNSFPSFLALASSVLYLPIFSGSTILSRWIYFMMDLAIYYVAFVILMWLLRKREDRLKQAAFAMLGIEVIVILVLTAISNITGSHVQMRACVMFPIGLLAARYDKAIFKQVKRFKYLISAVCFSLAVFFCVYAYYHLMGEYVICGLFATSVIALFVGVEIKSRPLEVASEHVVYVYLSHEFFFKLLRHQMPNLGGNSIMFISVICSVAVAIAAYQICKIKLKKMPPLLGQRKMLSLKVLLKDIAVKPSKKLKRAASATL